MKNKILGYLSIEDAMRTVSQVIRYSVCFSILYILWCISFRVCVLPLLWDKENVSSKTDTVSQPYRTFKKITRDPEHAEVKTQTVILEFAKGFGRVFKSAASEEFFYRFMTFMLLEITCVAFMVKRKIKITLLLLYGILSSISFGLDHGNYINIFIQGVGGAYYAWIFVFTARLDEIKKTFKDSIFFLCFGLFCSALGHTILNVTLHLVR